MKKTLAFIVLVALLVNCTYTLPHYFYYERKRSIVISKRVGETIEPEEREQFDLFHGIDEFKAATFYEITGDGYDVEIFTEHEKLIAYNRNPDAVMILRDYIERYEIIKDSMLEFEKKWGIVDYDVLGQPITTDEIKINSRRYWPGFLALSGTVVGCVSSCLIFGIPEVAVDVPSDYDDSESKNKIFIGLGSAGLGCLSGTLYGIELDKRDALRKIKDARKPRVVE